MKSHGNKVHDEFFEQFVAAIRRRCPIVFGEDSRFESKYVQDQLELEVHEAPQRARWGND